MGLQSSLIIVLSLVVLAATGAGVSAFQPLLAVVIPYTVLTVFLVGLCWRVFKWAQSPVPFRIPTTAGQQKSFSWLKANKLDNPSGTAGVIGRMLLEILFFRSLFRNTKAELRKGPKLAYGWEKWLWLAGLLFHWSFLIILIRHLRLFVQPVPALVRFTESLDGFIQWGLPTIYITDVLMVAAVTYLFLRRIVIPQLRYISLPADYFPLLMILGIAFSGITMRYFLRVDLGAVKELAVSLAMFSPKVPEGIGAVFYVHIFLVSVLFMYFSFSKLMHMGGIFLSPTRNLANNSRAKRHINPWNYPVDVHSYAEYEADFGKKMGAVGLPLERKEHQ